MSSLQIAVIGAGIIGRTHIDTLLRSDEAALCAIVDPTDAAQQLAAELQVAHFADIGDLLDAKIADAVVVASPNHTHVPLALALLAAGLPVLLEKPLAQDINEGQQLLDAVNRTGVPLLLGHHRRHNPIIKAAKRAIADGRLGELVTANVSSTLYKPADYFDTAWRRTPGQGGPLAINLSHEVDLLRHFFGEVSRVQGTVSNAQRGFAVEDSAAAILHFADGGLATLTITDAGCGPWAWDISAGENLARFPAHNISAHLYAGTKAGLSLPDLTFWAHPGAPNWTREMTGTRLDYQAADPYTEQLAHFCALIRDGGDPLVSCEDGLRNMQILDAIQRAARDDCSIELSSIDSAES
jgi:predicted dehydrogenase